MSGPPTPLVAGLPWYDHPASARGLDLFWAALADALRAAGHVGIPEALARWARPTEQWRDPGLLLSQCCGPDLFTAPGADLEVVARPAFSGLDAAPGTYFSWLVGERSALARPRVAINARSSRSGCGALAEWLRDRGLVPASVEETGSHAASLEAIRAGRADLAAIDAHAWHWLDSGGIGVLGRTAAAPSPPWVTRRGGAVGIHALRRALERAVAKRGAEIGIDAVMPARRCDYAPLEEEVLGIASVPE